MTSSESSSAHQYAYTVRPATPSDLPYLPEVEASAGTLFKSISCLEHHADDEPMSVQAHQTSLDKWYDGPFHTGGLTGGTWVAVTENTPPVLGTVINGEPKSEGYEVPPRNEKPVGFIVTDVLPVIRACSNGRYSDGNEKVEGYFIHINELSISTEHQRRGLAGRLLRTVRDFAVSLNEAAYIDSSSKTDPYERLPVLGLSLTTFQNVPFNRPFYEKFGFRIVEGDEEVEEVCGVEGLEIWKEDRERFEGLDEVESLTIRRRCWMICEL